MRTFRLVIIAASVAVLALFSFAGIASAHHITEAYADCDGQVIIIKGEDFQKKDWPATLDGPGEYEINDISADTKNWTMTFPLFQGESGGTGHYTFQWARGFHGFDVNCEVPPPPPPNPEPVATSVDCETFTVRGGPEGWTVLVVSSTFSVPDWTYGPFDGNGSETFDITPGGYEYLFRDENGDDTQFNGEFTVSECERATPTPSTPTPSTPGARPTPPPTDTSDTASGVSVPMTVLVTGALVAITITGAYVWLSRRRES